MVSVATIQDFHCCKIGQCVSCSAGCYCRVVQSFNVVQYSWMCTVHSAPVQDSDIWLCTVQRQGLHYKIRLCALPHCCGCTQCSCSSAAGTSPSPQTAFPQHCTALQSDFAGRVLRVGLTICLQMILAVCSVQCAVWSVTMCLGMIRPLTLQRLGQTQLSVPLPCLQTFICFITSVLAEKMVAFTLYPLLW